MATDSYLFRAREGDAGGPLLFLFHGTGGDENQLLGLGSEFLPGAALVAPRGDVSENGAARFFRRKAEGVYDMDDLARATHRMTGFVRAHAEEEAASAVVGLGYSNGANILASVMFAHPDLFDAVVLMHPLIPFEPRIAGDLSGRRVLVTAGRHDPICPPDMTERLATALKNAGAELTMEWHDGGHEVRPIEIDAARRFLAPYRADVAHAKGQSA